MKSINRDALLKFTANFIKFAVIICIALIFIFNNSYSKIDTLDLMPPQIRQSSRCGDFLINVNDDRSFQLNEDTYHLDLGIIDPPVLLESRSTNISQIHSSTFEAGKVNYDFSFRLSVLNKYNDAIAVFFVVDSTRKNFSYDSVVYKAEKLRFMPQHLHFGSVFVNTKTTLTPQILNISDFPVQIKSVKLKKGTVYTLDNSINNYILDTNESLNLSVTYMPVTDNYPDLKFDADTLIIETNCLVYTMPIFGNGVKAGIIVDDIDFDAVEVGKDALYHESYNPFYGKGLRISNPGTGVLILNGHHPLRDDSPFIVSKPTNPNILTLELNPKTERFISGIRFRPSSAGEFFDTLTIKSNGNGPDSICYLRGIAYNPGPFISSLNIGRVRVGDKKKGIVQLRNSSSQPIDVTGFSLSSTSNEFRIIDSETFPRVSENNPVKLYPNLPEYANLTQVINVTIEFSPHSEFSKEVKIFPEFSEKSNIPEKEVFNYIRGFGFKPAIEARGFTFPGRTLVNVKHTVEGKIQIGSSSWSSDLFIKKIEVIPVGFTLEDEFIFAKKLPEDTTINILSPIDIPVSFMPREAGDREANIRIITDAYTGVEGSKWDTTYVTLKGVSYNKVISVENKTLKDVFHCSENEIYVEVRNISNTSDAFITEVRAVTGDLDAFTVDSDSIDNNFVILDPYDRIYIKVKFSPANFDKDNFELFLRVFSDKDTSTGIIRANTVKRAVSVILPEIDNAYPGALLEYKPPRNYGPDFKITADLSELTEIEINEFEIDLKYNKKNITFVNQIERGELITDWDLLTAEETEIDNNLAQLKITGKGGTSISGKKGTLCMPVFMVLLGDSSATDVELVSASFLAADNCVNLSKTNGRIRLSYCGDEVRKIILSNRFYNLRSVYGNPVSSDNASISYTVAIDATTYVEMFNSYGESVALISNEFKPKGEYFYNINTTNLASGMYFVKMVSGPFTETIKLMIVK